MARHASVYMQSCPGQSECESACHVHVNRKSSEISEVCPSPSLLLYMRRDDAIRKDKGKQLEGHRSLRHQEAATFHLPVNHWDLGRCGGFGKEELRDGPAQEQKNLS